MKKITVATIVGSLIAAAALSLAHEGYAAEPASVEVAFSPNGGAEQLVLNAVNGSQHSVRVLAYALTAAPVVRALIAAKKRGVDVAVTVDYRENIEEDRSGKAHAALAALVAAGIPVRVVSALPLTHSKYLVIDQRTVETGSLSSASVSNLSSGRNHTLDQAARVLRAGRYDIVFFDFCTVSLAIRMTLSKLLSLATCLLSTLTSQRSPLQHQL